MTTPVLDRRPTPTSSATAPRRSLKDRGTRLLAALFLAPTLVGVLVFTVVPIVGSVVLSFFHWDVIGTPASRAPTTTPRSSRTTRSSCPSPTP